MKIEEVKDKRDIQDFLEFPVNLYNDEPHWIRPLDKDIEEVFDKNKNKFFRNGEAIRWLLKSDNGEIIGRVAAFIDYKSAKTYKHPTGGMGFFECINDKNAAFALFDQCKAWLQERGMEAMNGPINFGDRDRWWGLLVDGFDIQPNYRMNYHLPYYQKFFEDYGFNVYFKQYTYGIEIKEGQLKSKVIEKGERILNSSEFTFTQISKKNLEKYAEDFRTIYNKAWAHFKGVNKMAKAQAMSIMNSLRPIIDERIMWFAYHNGEPAAFFLALPEVNQIFKHVNGKMDLIGKLKFLYHKKMETCDKMFGLVFGVTPEHQGKGLESAIVLYGSDFLLSKKCPYKFIELNWIGDFNPKMMRVAEDVGGHIIKTHHTYRLLFDENEEDEKMDNV